MHEDAATGLFGIGCSSCSCGWVNSSGNGTSIGLFAALLADLGDGSASFCIGSGEVDIPRFLLQSVKL